MSQEGNRGSIQHHRDVSEAGGPAHSLSTQPAHTLGEIDPATIRDLEFKDFSELFGLTGNLSADDDADQLTTFHQNEANNHPSHPSLHLDSVSARLPGSNAPPSNATKPSRQDDSGSHSTIPPF